MSAQNRKLLERNKLKEKMMLPAKMNVSHVLILPRSTTLDANKGENKDAWQTNPDKFLHIPSLPADTRFCLFNFITTGGIDYMKATGIVRRIDDLGRVVIPKEIRRTMRIREGDPSLTTLSWWERYCLGVLDLAKREGWEST